MFCRLTRSDRNVGTETNFPMHILPNWPSFCSTRKHGYRVYRVFESGLSILKLTAPKFLQYSEGDRRNSPKMANRGRSTLPVVFVIFHAPKQSGYI